MSYSEGPRGAKPSVNFRIVVCLAVFVVFVILFDISVSAESVRRDFGYPVGRRLEIKRFRRRADEATLARDASSRDYMSTYYAQRKAIMEKYNSQQREISERLERTKSLVLAKQRLRGSKAKVKPEDEARDSPSVSPTPTDFEGGVRRPLEVFPTFDDSATFNVTDSEIIEASVAPIAEGSTPPPSPSSTPTDVVAVENSTETDSPAVVSSADFYSTVRSVGNNDAVTGESAGEISEVNFPPSDEVDLNFRTQESPVSRGRDNETLIIDLLSAGLTNHPWKNDSASAELEKMFLWEVEAGEERLQRSNGSANSTVVVVRVENSPGIHVANNVKDSRSSTTTYRNSTHEVVEVDGVVTDVRRIADVPSGGVGREAAAGNWTIGGEASVPGEVYGGADESEWCEICPHDYRWGECEGTLFYQHNIFLRNRGPSAIDAVFGMEVQGPVDVTCVEALRFNQTRGIVSLHSGGPGHDFAKLRIRGFRGEGFSYIMKVWGVNSENRANGTASL